LLAVCFRNVPPPDWLGTVRACSEIRLDASEEWEDPGLLDGLNGLPIEPWRTTVAADPLPRLPQDVIPVDPVVKGVEAACATLLGAPI
jgi:hypothetical protein